MATEFSALFSTFAPLPTATAPIAFTLASLPIPTALFAIDCAPTPIAIEPSFVAPSLL